jgi:acetyl esterase/lipase
VRIGQGHAAAVWASQNGEEIGVDASKLAVTGNSVGGNMAAAVTLMARDEGEPNVVYRQLP